MEALSIKNLTKHFDGVTALDGVSLECAARQITSVIGPNGSGKSTLTNVLTGITPSDGGSAHLGLKSWPKNRELLHRHGVARTFQEARLFSQISTLDNLLLALAPRGAHRALTFRPSREMRQRACDLLDRVGLADKKSARGETLSYGQRKLLEIARVLALEPSIIFYDEPCAGLFPEMIERIEGIMRELRAKGVTQILIEHSIELIRRISDRVIVLDAGSVLAQGTVDEVVNDPRVIAAYLGK